MTKEELSELFEIFGQLPEIMEFDENIYDVDLSFIISSL